MDSYRVAQIVHILGQAHCDTLTNSLVKLQDSNYFYSSGIFISEKEPHARQLCKLFRVGILKLVKTDAAFQAIQQFVQPVVKLLLIASEQNWVLEVYYMAESLALIVESGMRRDSLLTPDGFDQLKTIVLGYQSYVTYAAQKFSIEPECKKVDHVADFMFLASLPNSTAKHLGKSRRFETSIRFLLKVCEILTSLDYPFKELSDIALTGRFNHSNTPILKLLEIILSHLESYGSWQVCGMLFLSHQDIFSSILKHPDTNGATRTNVKRVFELVLTPLVSRYPTLSEDIAVNALESIFQPPQWYGKPDCTRRALEFLLNALDNGLSIDYLDSLQALSAIHLSIKQVSMECHSKLDIYYYLNPLSSKLGLTTICMSANYYLAANLLATSKFGSIPDAIQSKMRLLENPPLPKPDSLFLFKNCESEPELKIYSTRINFDIVLEAITFNLYMASFFIGDEMSALCFINQASSELLRQKMVFKFTEMVLSSLVTSLMLTQVCHHRVLAFESIQVLAYTIIDSLLRHNLAQESDQYQMWVCLLNFANDVCYSDLKYVPIISDLFDSLTQQNPECLESPLVKSGLSLFESTFRHTESEALMELSLSDYKFLYETPQGITSRNISTPASAWGSATMAGDPSVYESAKLSNSQSRPAQTSRSGYFTSAGRQQSVHVDQYGKS